MSFGHNLAFLSKEAIKLAKDQETNLDPVRVRDLLANVRKRADGLERKVLNTCGK
jgi:hypothetical protein